MEASIEINKKKGHTTAKRGYKYLVKQITKFSPMIILSVTLAFVDSATYTFVPRFTQYIIGVLDPSQVEKVPRFIEKIGNLGGSNAIMCIVYVAIGLFVYQFIRGILKFLASLFRDFIGQTLTLNMRKDLYEHIQSLPYTYHNGADTGDLIQRCTSDVDAVQNFISRQMPQILSTFGILIAAIWQMADINRKLTWVSLIIVPVAFISSLLFCLYIQRAYEKIEKTEAELMTVMQENLAGVRVVKAFANEKYELDRFKKINDSYAKQSLRMQKNSALYWGFSDFTTMAQMMLIMTVAIYITKNEPISVASVATMVTLCGSFIWPIRGLGRIIGDMGKSAVSAGRIKEILDIKSEYDDDATEMPMISGQIEFDNVGFKFDDTDKHLLKGISFSVKPGETIAIIGKTGSGKSTVAKLLTRLHDYQSGSIRIDGHELKNINKKYLRTQVGLVLQEPFLYSRTVFENIAITDKKINEEQVYKVAKISSLEKDIKGFEKGYNTLVGEKGATLSGGQKQRVAIARILLKQHPIIIFDDSLSALDSETDLLVRRALKEREEKSTTIIITHRITTAKQADKIIVLENGLISQMGTHDELANVEGLYKKLWHIQGELEEEFLKVLAERGDDYE